VDAEFATVVVGATELAVGATVEEVVELDDVELSLDDAVAVFAEPLVAEFPQPTMKRVRARRPAPMNGPIRRSESVDINLYRTQPIHPRCIAREEDRSNGPVLFDSCSETLGQMSYPTEGQMS
jgi:hypothetical protein